MADSKHGWRRASGTEDSPKWNPDMEVSLFNSMKGHKPVGELLAYPKSRGDGLHPSVLEESCTPDCKVFSVRGE